MEKIEKVLIFKKDDNFAKGIVIYANNNFEEFSYKNLKKEILKFQNQENCSIDELNRYKKIIVYRNFRKYKEIKDILKEKSCFVNSRQFLDRFMPVILITSTISFIFSNFIYIGNSIVENFILFFSSYLSMFSSIPTLKINKIGKKYDIKGIKKYELFTILSLMLSFSSLYNETLPSPKTIPYYFELNHTDIDDTNNYDNLSDEEKHIKECETIFKNIKNNPYLDEEEIKILHDLEPFVLEDPYLDMTDVLNKLMTIRINKKYSLSQSVSAVYNPIGNKIDFYYNVIDDKENTLLHEYLHAIGSLDNKILNEGMTSLLTGDIQKCDTIYYDGYIHERYCMQYVIELVGSDLVLEAYSKNNMELIDKALTLKFGNMETVEEFYSLLEKNCKQNYDNLEITEFILNHLNEDDKNEFYKNNTIEKEDGTYFVLYKRRYNFSK